MNTLFLSLPNNKLARLSIYRHNTKTLQTKYLRYLKIEQIAKKAIQTAKDTNAPLIVIEAGGVGGALLDLVVAGVPSRVTVLGSHPSAKSPWDEDEDENEESTAIEAEAQFREPRQSDFTMIYDSDHTYDFFEDETGDFLWALATIGDEEFVRQVNEYDELGEGGPLPEESKYRVELIERLWAVVEDGPEPLVHVVPEGGPQARKIVRLSR